MPLSDTSVRNAKAQDKALKLFDGGGLFPFVSPAGGKLWRLTYRFQGKEKLLALGAYPDISLKDTRKRRDEAKELLAKDIDPAEVKKEAKATAAALELEMATTFEAVAREWFSKKKHAWTSTVFEQPVRMGQRLVGAVHQGNEGKMVGAMADALSFLTKIPVSRVARSGMRGYDQWQRGEGTPFSMVMPSPGK